MSSSIEILYEKLEELEYKKDSIDNELMIRDLDVQISDFKRSISILEKNESN